MSDLSPSDTDIQQLFDRIAPVYDELNDRLSLGLHWVWKQMAVKWSQPTAGDYGLDLCCGSGDLALLLAKQVGRGGKVVGVDFAAGQLAIARDRSRQYPLLSFEWVEADVLKLPFEADSFDCATMGYGLRNVTDIPTCLSEIYRVLKPGATAAILDFHRPYSQWMQNFQQWYLNHFVVPTATDLGFRQEYTYINSSLAKFPLGCEQVRLSQSVGFTSAVHYPITGGMMGVLVVTK